MVTQVPGASADWVEDVEGVSVHYLRAPDRLRAATLFAFDALRMRKAALALKPDIVHAHGTEDAYPISALACGLPWVLTAQGCYFIINTHIRPRLISRERLIEFTEWLAFRRTRHAIAKSEYIEKAIKARFPHVACHRIPNTFDESLLALPARKKIPGHLAFVGSFEHRKGLYLLREALAARPELAARVTVRVFGDRPDAGTYRQSEIELWRELLGERIIINGVLPISEVAVQVSECEALVAPSLEEMFGNQVIESLLVKTPVIVTDETAMAENVRRFGGGLVVAQQNANALGDAVDRLLKDPALAGDSRTVRQNIESAMSPQAVAQAHRELYERILSETGRR